MGEMKIESKSKECVSGGEGNTGESLGDMDDPRYYSHPGCKAQDLAYKYDTDTYEYSNMNQEVETKQQQENNEEKHCKDGCCGIAEFVSTKDLRIRPRKPRRIRRKRQSS